RDGGTLAAGRGTAGGGVGTTAGHPAGGPALPPGVTAGAGAGRWATQGRDGRVPGVGCGIGAGRSAGGGGPAYRSAGPDCRDGWSTWLGPAQPGSASELSARPGPAWFGAWHRAVRARDDQGSTS